MTCSTELIRHPFDPFACIFARDGRRPCHIRSLFFLFFLLLLSELFLIFTLGSYLSISDPAILTMLTFTHVSLLGLLLA